ncbi:hypothetical protein HK405_002335 [Cladochytrium tenue]|nr:hypothetical protein HK405_002335 [Cladochytrium tenue]
MLSPRLQFPAVSASPALPLPPQPLQRRALTNAALFYRLSSLGTGHGSSAPRASGSRAPAVARAAPSMPAAARGVFPGAAGVEARPARAAGAAATAAVTVGPMAATVASATAWPSRRRRRWAAAVAGDGAGSFAELLERMTAAAAKSGPATAMGKVADAAGVRTALFRPAAEVSWLLWLQSWVVAEVVMVGALVVKLISSALSSLSDPTQDLDRAAAEAVAVCVSAFATNAQPAAARFHPSAAGVATAACVRRLCAAGELDIAQTVLLDGYLAAAAEYGVSVSVLPFRALVEGLAAAGEPRKALQVLDNMRRHGLNPGAPELGPIIRACGPADAEFAYAAFVALVELAGRGGGDARRHHRTRAPPPASLYNRVLALCLAAPDSAGGDLSGSGGFDRADALAALLERLPQAGAARPNAETAALLLAHAAAPGAETQLLNAFETVRLWPGASRLLRCDQVQEAVLRAAAVVAADGSGFVATPSFEAVTPATGGRRMLPAGGSITESRSAAGAVAQVTSATAVAPLPMMPPATPAVYTYCQDWAVRLRTSAAAAAAQSAADGGRARTMVAARASPPPMLGEQATRLLEHLRAQATVTAGWAADDTRKVHGVGGGMSETALVALRRVLQDAPGRVACELAARSRVLAALGRRRRGEQALAAEAALVQLVVRRAFPSSASTAASAVLSAANGTAHARRQLAAEAARALGRLGDAEGLLGLRRRLGGSAAGRAALGHERVRRAFVWADAAAAAAAETMNTTTASTVATTGERLPAARALTTPPAAAAAVPAERRRLRSDRVAALGLGSPAAAAAGMTAGLVAALARRVAGGASGSPSSATAACA